MFGAAFRAHVEALSAPSTGACEGTSRVEVVAKANRFTFVGLEIRADKLGRHPWTFGFALALP